jgi:peptide subunit release factor RF-3
MQSEYDVELKLTPLNFSVARWVKSEFDPTIFTHSIGVKLLQDRDGRPVLLFDSASTLRWNQEKHTGLLLAETGD